MVKKIKEQHQTYFSLICFKAQFASLFASFFFGDVHLGEVAIFVAH